MPGIYRDYDKIIEIYNATGSKEAQSFIQETYGTQNPRCLISRMKKSEKFGYDKASGKFLKKDKLDDEMLFLDLDDLCTGEVKLPKKKQQVLQNGTDETIHQHLYHQLIQEKLLFLLNYINFSAVDRIITIDKTRLSQDGVRLNIL